MPSLVDMTFEAWFTWGGGDAWQRVFDFGRTSSGSGQDYVFYTPSNGGDNRAAIRNNALPENIAFGGPPVSIGPTHHVVVAIDDDANGGSNQMLLYLDGELADDVGLSYSLNQLSNSLAYLGRSLFTNDAYLNGTIDEFRVYNHGLSQAEVTTSYTTGPVPLDQLRLNVNTVTGNVSVVNDSTSTLAFDYYRVSSAVVRSTLPLGAASTINILMPWAVAPGRAGTSWAPRPPTRFQKPFCWERRVSPPGLHARLASYMTRPWQASGKQAIWCSSLPCRDPTCCRALSTTSFRRRSTGTTTTTAP